MATPLTGVQWSQPALATAPRSVEPPASAAAGFRATALARVPPNHAARPTSCIEREIVSRAITFLPDRICGLRYPRGSAENTSRDGLLPRQPDSGDACGTRRRATGSSSTIPRTGLPGAGCAVVGCQTRISYSGEGSPMSVIATGAGQDARSLVDSLDQRVRESVRREGVDPQRDTLVVRRLAEAVARAHDERSLTGAVAPVADVEAMVGELVARLSGFAPLQPYLDDPTVEEIWINDPSRVFVARRGRHELTNLMLSRAQVQELVERMLKSSGRRIDISRPFVDAMLPEGHRLHVVLEGISRGWTAVNVRKFVLTAARLHELVELGTLTTQAAAFLEASVRAGLNILVAGATQAGKTTLLNCLAAAIPGGERVISAEEVFELRFPHPDWVAMQTRQSGLEGTGEIKLRDLVKESLRM